MHADGNIRVKGYFRQSDTFSPGLQPGRRLVLIYVMYSENINNIVKTAQVLDYTDGTDWKYKDLSITGLTPGKLVKVGIGRPDAWVADWKLVAEWADIRIIEGAPPGGVRFSLREHGLFRPSYSPDIRFLKPSSGVLRIDSYQAGTSSMGYGAAFVVVPRDWLNGKYIRFNWSGYFSYSQPREGIARAWIYDGEYDRTNDADFPEGASIPTKGAGLLQTLVVKNTYGSWGPETVDVLVNVAAGTEPKCTIFFLMGDGWYGQTVFLDVDWFQINQGPGGDGTLAVENFDADVIMERTGTYGDYGYISSGDINP